MATLLRILKHRVVLLTMILLGLATVLELAAPPAIRSFAIHWLHDHGIADARIGAVRINPFTWSMSVYNLKAGPGLQVGRAAINIDWWPLLHHQIYVRDIALDHAHLELAQGSKGAWMIAGLVMPAAAPAAADSSKPWYAILHQVTLKDVRIRLSGRDLKLDVPIRSLDIDHAFLSQAGNQVLNTTLRLGPSSFSGLGYRVDDASLQLHGQVILPGPGATDTPIAARHVVVKMKGLATDAKDGQLALSIGNILLSGVSMQGPTDFKANDIEAESLHVNANPAKKADMPERISLASVRKLSLNTLSVTNMKHVTFARLALRGIALPAAKKQSMGSIMSIAATDADIASPDSIRLGRLDIQHLKLALLHEKGGLAVLKHLETPPPAATSKRAPSKQTPATEASLPSIHIGHVTIDKGSKISFEDDAVDPPVRDELEVKTFRFAPLEIGGKQPGTIDAAFRVGDQGSLAIRGDMNLDRANPMAKLTVDLKRLSMPPLSGYLAKGFGYTIGTGQMDVDSQISIHHQAIDAKNKLAIRNLALKATKQSDKATQSVGMPLDMAVSMLQNDRGDISLNVPVSGRLDDPNVNINDAINQALASAIKSGAMSYASLLLQPYGSILPALSLAKGLLAEASKPRLTPITFAPRKAVLSDQAKAYIGKIALLLKQKPFRLQACGIAGQVEFEDKSQGKQPVDKTMNKRLLSLADARSTAVIKALVAAGISPDRIFECQPQIDSKANASGRVELLLN